MVELWLHLSRCVANFFWHTGRSHRREDVVVKFRLLSGSLAGWLLAAPFFAAIGFSACAQTGPTSMNLGLANVAGSKVETTVVVAIPTARTLSNIAVVTQGAESKDFVKADGGSCTVGVAYEANSSCTVKVEFAPRFAGIRYGAVVLRDQYGDVIGTTYLHGKGLGPQVSFVPGIQARVSGGFPAPQGLAVDGSGNFYVAENLYYQDIYPGGSPTYGYVMKDGVAIGSNWVSPTSIAVDGAGIVYVSDVVGGIWKLIMQPDHSYSQTLAVSGGNRVAVDGSGNLYTFDYQLTAYKETLQPDGSYLPTEIASGFVNPLAVTVDESGNVYIADGGMISFSGAISGGAVYKETLANGKYKQTLLGTGWTSPSAIAVDGAGNVYVNDSRNVYKEALQADGSYLQTTIVNKVASAGGLVVDAAGRVYIPEYTGFGQFEIPYYSIFRVDYSQPGVVSFDAAQHGATSADGPKSVTVSNLGNTALNISEVRYPSDFPESSIGSSDCAAGTTLKAGESCPLTVEFTPTTKMGGAVSTPLSESVDVTTNTLNTDATMQGVGVSGTEVPHGPVETPRLSLAPGTYIGSRTFTISDENPNATIYYTIHGPKPSITSAKYTGPITVTDSSTVDAVAAAPGYLNSAIASSYFTINKPPAPMPEFTVAAGTYGSTQTVSIADSAPGAVIYYSLHAVTPTRSSAVYTGPITVSSTETIRAFAVAPGFAASEIAVSTYKIK